MVVDWNLVEDAEFEGEVGFSDLFAVGILLWKSTIDEAFAEGFLVAGVEFGGWGGFDLDGGFGFGVACFVEEGKTDGKFFVGSFGRSSGALLKFAFNGVMGPKAIGGGRVDKVSDGVGVIFESEVLCECFVAGILGDQLGPIAQKIEGTAGSACVLVGLRGTAFGFGVFVVFFFGGFCGGAVFFDL